MSNLLEKASILTTPTAYENGKILSVKPEPSLGSELVTNGDFENGSANWSTNDWVIANGIATATNIANSLNQSLSVTLGATYSVSINVLYSDDVLGLRVKIGGVFSDYFQEGLHTLLITTTGTQSLQIVPRSSNSTYSIDSVSVKQLIDADFDFTRNSSATRVNSQGLIEDITSNLPRIDYTGGTGHWLFEPQSTNLFPYSDASSGFTKTKVTTSNNQGTSPDGSNNATKMLMTSGTGSHRVYQAIPSSLNDNNTLSVFIKEQSEVSHIGLTAKTAGTIVAWFSGSDGSIINANGLDAKTQSLSNGWHRISISYVSDDTLAADNQFVYFSNRENTSANPAFNGTETVLMYGFQVEKLSYATSYIPTEGSIKTRLQDAAFGAGSSDLINSTEGVLYAEIAALADDGTNRNISLSEDASNRINIFYRTGSNRIRFIVRINDANLFDTSITLSNITNYNKVALSFKENEFKVYVNGVKEVEQLTGSIFPTDTLDKLGFNQNISGGSPFYGKTKCVAVFKEALTDAELTCLTTI